ncbi:MAG: GerMN domain-containing protein [Cellulosilyticaceae bacterium]
MKIKIKWLYGLLCIVLLGLLVGCFGKGISSGYQESILLYFYSHPENTLVAEEVPLKITPNSTQEQLMMQVIEALYKGPQNTSIQGVQPIKAIVNNIPQLKEQTAYITFDASYNELSVEEQITARASIVFSLTELEFIQGVEFSVEGEPLANSNGEKVGTVKRVDILISPINPSPPTSKQIVTLYFANPIDHKLYPEMREVEINNKSIERYIVEELIKGPTTPGLVATLPSDAKINNDAKTQDGVCQVDLSYDLKSAQVATPLSEKLMIYSVVNSLTEIRKVQKVGFLMEGKKPTDISTTIDFSQLFERDESIIESDE